MFFKLFEINLSLNFGNVGHRNFGGSPEKNFNINNHKKNLIQNCTPSNIRDSGTKIPWNLGDNWKQSNYRKFRPKKLFWNRFPWKKGFGFKFGNFRVSKKHTIDNSQKQIKMLGRSKWANKRSTWNTELRGIASSICFPGFGIDVIASYSACIRVICVYWNSEGMRNSENVTFPIMDKLKGGSRVGYKGSIYKITTIGIRKPRIFPGLGRIFSKALVSLIFQTVQNMARSGIFSLADPRPFLALTPLKKWRSGLRTKVGCDSSKFPCLLLGNLFGSRSCSPLNNFK